MAPTHPSRDVSSAVRPLHWTFLGAVPYAPTYRLQEELRRAVRCGEGPEHLLLLEHRPPCYTLGRNASENDVVAARAWLAARGIEVHQTNRGGKVTYHGPGQLVGYPIVSLKPDRLDVRRYVHDLLDVLVLTLADYGIAAVRRDEQELIGVWVGGAKIASVGVHLARWITLHGFALNVAPDLSHFEGIVACGLQRVRMTSIERLTGLRPPLSEIAERVARHFGRVFNRQLVAADAARLRPGG